MGSVRAAHPGASGVLAQIGEAAGVVESLEQTEPGLPVPQPHQTQAHPRVQHGAGGHRLTPLGVALVALLGGGSGIGSSWLLGPGGWRDDSKMREQVEAASASAASAASSASSALAKYEECERDIDDIADDSREMQLWIAAALQKQGAVLQQLAAKEGMSVDLSLPPLTTARRRR